MTKSAGIKSGGDGARLAGLDALRGIAAVSVMLYHYTFGYQAAYGQAASGLPVRSGPFVFGHLGVQLFFMISGYVIFMSLDQTRRLRDFAIARFARLYPPFLVAMALTMTAVTAGRVHHFDLGWADIAANFTMMASNFGFNDIDPSYWSLGYEVRFYMMAGLFFAFLDRKFVELACIVWLTAAWFAAGHGPIVDALTATKFAYLFVLGIMFRRIATGEATGVTYAAIGLALFISGTIGNAVSVPISGFENFLITAGFSALFWVGVKGWFPAWAMPFLVYLGGISYSLYLLHQEIGFVVIHRLTQAGLPMFASIVVAILVAMLLAAGTRILVEKPSLQWARRYRAGLLAAPPAGAAETAVRLG